MCFAFYPEIQDGHQKWWENYFCKKSSVDSADTLDTIISEINVFLRFTQKFKIAAKNFGGKIILQKIASTLCRYPWVNFVEIALSRTVSEMKNIFVLCRNSRWPPKMVQKRFSGKVTSRICR